MKSRIELFVLFFLTALFLPSLQAAPAWSSFRFHVVGSQPLDDASFVAVLRQATIRQPAFTVINGVRPSNENCTDSGFRRRKKMIHESEKPVFVSLLARDWAECRNDAGEPAAQDRLNFLRGLLFDEMVSRSSGKLAVVRQSSSNKFRSYSENMRWELGGVLFATLNLPSNNNHYLAAAGRNNEFEDRLIANRNWLQRIFSYAKIRRMKAVVLFMDGNPMSLSTRSRRKDRRDGFSEVRAQLTNFSKRYSGKILLVHGQASSGHITWRDKLGIIGAGAHTMDISVRPKTKLLFFVRRVGGVKQGKRNR